MLEGSSGDDGLIGKAGGDILYGGKGEDILLGGAGDDRLYGSRGEDILVGGSGDDLLVGGRGIDEFIFANEGQKSGVSPNGPHYITDYSGDAPYGYGHDTIRDYESGEKLNFFHSRYDDLQISSSATEDEKTDILITDGDNSATLLSLADGVILNIIDSTGQAEEYIVNPVDIL